MKKHRLYRSYGKRQWTIGMFDTMKEAKVAASEHARTHGHLYPPLTTMAIESITFMGFVRDNALSPKSGVTWTRAS